MSKRFAKSNKQDGALEKNIAFAQRYCRQQLDSVDEPALILDADLLILHVNTPLVKQLEYSAEDLRGAPLGILLAEVDCEQLARYLAGKDADGLSWSETTFCHRYDGIAYLARVEIAPADKAPRNTRLYHCQITRVAESKTAASKATAPQPEHAANGGRREDFYRELVGTLPDIVYQRKLDGTLIFVSRIVESFLGYQPEEMTGMIQEYLSDHPMNDPYLDLVDSAAPVEIPFEPVVCEFQHKHGGSIFLQVRENLIRDAHGKPRYVQGLLQIPPESESDKAHAAREIHYDQIFQNLKFGLWVEDAQGAILDANHALQRLLDYDAAAIRNLTRNDLLAPDRILDFQGRVNRLGEGGSIEFESVALDSQARKVAVELTISSVTLEQETVLLVQVREAAKQNALSRILKLQNQELALCNAVMRQLLLHDPGAGVYRAALGEMIRALNADAGFVYYQEGDEWRRIQLDREGRNAPEYEAEFPLESGLLEQVQRQKIYLMRELTQDPASLFSPALKRGGMQSAVALLCSQERGRGLLLLLLSANYEHFNDHELRLVEMIARIFQMALEKRAQDTRLPATPELLATMLHNSVAPALIFDGQGAIEYWNPACALRLGLPREEAEGQSLEQLLGRRAGEMSMRDVISAVIEGREFERLSCTAFERQLQLALYPVRDADGGIQRGVCLIAEQTQPEAAPAPRPEETQAAGPSHELISFQDLAGGIGNEFNNQLNAIMGYTSLLQNDLASGDPHQNYLRLIQDAGRRSSRLAQQLLSWSGDSAFQPQPLNLNELVKTVMPRLLEQLDPRVRLITRLSPSMADFEGNPHLIEQSLINLCRFCGAAMPAGGRLALETFLRNVSSIDLPEGSELKAGKYAILRIQDQGGGLSAEALRNLYLPSMDRRHPELGLGLAAVRCVMQNHFGEIIVHSVPGAGTRFDLYFPVEWIIETPPPFKVPPGAETGKALPCALIIDDNRTVRQVTRKMLELLGYDFQEAENGLQGVRLFAADPQQYDLVLLDMMMPVMSGRETYECLCALREDLPVIFTSGYQVERIARRLELGAKVGYLQKPFTLDELERVLNLFLPVA